MIGANREMKVLDLFCGAGGFSTGFQQAGHQIVYGIDNDVRVKKTYQKNHPNAKFILNDIQKLNPKDFIDVDILIGSPPCPEFSVANNNRDIERGMELVNVFRDWVEVIQPKYWVMENVPPIEPYLDGRYPKKVILNAVNYGVPQFRKRCFAGKFRVPVPTHAKVPIYNLEGQKLQKWRTVREAISDLLMLPPRIILTDQRGSLEKLQCNSPMYDATNRPSRTLTNIPPRQLIAEGWQDAESVRGKKYMQIYKPLELTKPARTVTGRQGCNIQQAELRLDAVVNHYCMDNVIESKFDQSNREVKPNRPAPTINTHFRSERKIKTQIMQRRLSVRECARLQSFPDEFIFYGSITAQYTMVGNAVPPKLSLALAKMLL